METQSNAAASPRPLLATPDHVTEDQDFFESIESFLFNEGTLAEVVGLTEDDVDLMIWLGDQQLEAGRLEDAQVIYEGCVVLDPFDPSTLCRLATVRYLGGDPDGAEGCFEAAQAVCDDPGPIAAYRQALVNR
jgi:hypothetical protein